MTPITLRLRELRENRGWTQEHLAERAGVRQAAISEMESGKRRRLDMGILERLADAFGVEPGELLERENGRRRRG